jgi:hypothetical protein
VDGAECLTIGLDDPRPTRLTVGGDARLLEVSGRDERDEVLLANFLLSHNELLRARPSKECFVRLTRARELLLTVFPRIDGEGEIEGADIELVYRRVGPLGVVLKLWERPGVDRPALAFGAVGLALLIVAGMLTGLTFLIKRAHTTQPAFEYVAQVEEPPTPAPTSASGPDFGQRDSQTGREQDSTTRNKREVSKPSGSSVSVNGSSQKGRADRPKEGTRDFTFQPVRGLLSVKLVYVEEHTKGPDAGLRVSIMGRITTGGRLLISDEPQQADAFLLWSLKRTRAGRQIEARLTDRQGRELWRGSQTIRGTDGNQETASQAASKLAQNLLDEITRREGPRK